MERTHLLSDVEWLELLSRSAEDPDAAYQDAPLPRFPDRAVQLRTVGMAGADTMREAWGFAAECLARFRYSSHFGVPHKTLMDFGTGWGRIARCFLRDFRAEHIIGVDVDPDLVRMCRDTFSQARFL